MEKDVPNRRPAARLGRKTLIHTALDRLDAVCFHEDCDVGATECAHIQCVLPVMCRAKDGTVRRAQEGLSFFAARRPSM